MIVPLAAGCPAAYDCGVPLTSWQNFRLYLGRALRLRCPECGLSPLFVPARRVRSIWNWFTPLDGCPRCGYAYERESGYFLLATWAFNYGIVGLVGIVAAVLLDIFFHPPLTALIVFLLISMPLMSFLFARHAKSLYLAMDHFCDPEGHGAHRH